MTMETVEILTKARELISDESRWTKNDYAADNVGYVVEFSDPRACAFCALGAILRVVEAKDDNDPTAREADRLLVRAIGGTVPYDVAVFNDTHSHGEVLDLFDRAIALAKEG